MLLDAELLGDEVLIGFRVNTRESAQGRLRLLMAPGPWPRHRRHRNRLLEGV